MHYQKHLPAVPLDPYILCYYHWQGPDTLAGPLVIDSPPPGFAALVFNLGEEYLINNYRDPIHAAPRVFLAGQQVNRFQLRLTGSIRTLGVVFRPAGAAALLRTPMFETVNERLELGSLIPAAEARILTDRLGNAKSTTEQFHLLDDYFLHCLAQLDLRPGPIDFAANYILDNFTDLRIEDLLQRAFLSRRQFERRFLRDVGVSAKYFAKVRRVGYICNHLIHHPEVDWQEIVDLGKYYDQAHFIHEFKEFMGVTPSVYVEENNELAKHL